jgi:hypothetical protein
MGDYLSRYLKSPVETLDYIASLVAGISCGKQDALTLSEKLWKSPYVLYYLRKDSTLLHLIERELLSPPEVEALIRSKLGVSEEEARKAFEWERILERKRKIRQILLFSLPLLALLGLLSLPVLVGAVGMILYSTLPITKKEREAKKASEIVNKKLLEGIEDIVRDIRKEVNADWSLTTLIASSPLFSLFLRYPSPTREIILLPISCSLLDTLYLNFPRIKKRIEKLGKDLTEKFKGLPLFSSLYSVFERFYPKIKPRLSSFLKRLGRIYERHSDKIFNILYLIGLPLVYSIPDALLLYVITPYVSRVGFSRRLFMELSKPLLSSLYKSWPRLPERVRRALVYCAGVVVGGVKPFDEKEMKETAKQAASDLYEVTALKDAAKEVIKGLEIGTVRVVEDKGFYPPFDREGAIRLGYCTVRKVLEGEKIGERLEGGSAAQKLLQYVVELYEWKVANPKLLQEVAELYKTTPEQILENPLHYLFLDFEKGKPIAGVIEICVRNYRAPVVREFAMKEEVYHAIQIAEVTRRLRGPTPSTIPANLPISPETYTP